jgi:hypothetical protein
VVSAARAQLPVNLAAQMRQRTVTVAGIDAHRVGLVLPDVEQQRVYLSLAEGTCGLPIKRVSAMV